MFMVFNFPFVQLSLQTATSVLRRFTFINIFIMVYPFVVCAVYGLHTKMQLSLHQSNSYHICIFPLALTSRRRSR